MSEATRTAEAPFVQGAKRDARPSIVPGRPNTLKPGTILQGRYRIQEVLGVGGMSTVYRSRDLRFAGVDRQCAVKEMFNVGDDARVRQLRLTNFQREAALLATLSHVAIPRIYDFFEHHGSIYLVLELIQGHDLESMLGQHGGPFPEEDLIRWGLELCDVMNFLHGQQPEPIIFRDMKPSNVMARPDGRIALIDFGIARTFAPQQKGTMIGTEGYAPPEQYRGVADVRGDVYAFGATLHHLATGSDPRSETPFTFAQRPPRRLNSRLSPEFEQVILKAVSYSPADRYATVEELRGALKEIRDRDVRSPAPASVSPDRRDRAMGSAILTLPTADQRERSAGSGVLSPPAETPGTGQVRSGHDRIDWVCATRDEVRGSASHAGGAVYIGSYDHHLYAIDETDGSVRWKFRCQRGVVSRPAVAADLVIFGSEDHNVYAVSRQQGRAVWTFRSTMPVRSSPRVDDKSCYIGSDDGFVYRLDRVKGTVLWRHRTWGPVRSTPILDENRIVFGSEDGYVYSLEAESGKQLWRAQCDAPVVASPVRVGRRYVVGGMDGTVRSLDWESGRVGWTFPTGKPILATAATMDETVYVPSANGSLYALDGQSGMVNWQEKLCRQITSSPVIDGELLYVGGADGVLRALNRQDGSPRWQVGTDKPIVSRPLVTADHVIVGSLDHQIYAVHRTS